MPDCLVCGAYEALALHRPVVMSDSKAARELFTSGVEFVDNTAQSIAIAVQKILADQERYDREAASGSQEYLSSWLELERIALSKIDDGSVTRGVRS
jgi:glycosyltransferase involved in cell wall biosynthesis